MHCLLHIRLILFSLEKRSFINISLEKCSSEKSLDWFGLYWHFYHMKPTSLPQKKPPKHAINKCRMTLTFKHFTQNTPIQFKMAISDFNLNEYRYIVNIICVYKNSRTIGPTSWEWMIEELYRSWTNPAFTPLTLKVLWTQLFPPWTDYESSIINTC